MNGTLYTPPATGRFRSWIWLAVILVFFAFISLIKGILLPFVVGILSAYFLDPAVRRLRRWGWSRSLSAAIITIGFFVIAATICMIVAPLIAHQMTALARQAPDYIRNLQLHYSRDIERYIARLDPEQVGTIRDAVGNFSGAMVEWAGRMATNVVQSGLAILNVLSLIFIMPIVAFYLLRDWDHVVGHIDHLLPRDHVHTIREQMHAIDRTLSGFLRGQTNVCLIMAAWLGTALSLAGLNFGLLIGIVTGLFLFLPFVAVASGFALSVIVASFQFGWSAQLLAVVGIFAVGLAAENSFLTPRLVGGKVNLHPLWIIFGMLAGGALFGFVGILISVPLTAVMGVLVRFAAARYLQSSLYLGTPKGMATSAVLLSEPSA